MTIRKIARSRYAIVGVIATSLAAPQAVFAQLDEVVVTARKREENLQDIPVVVTAFTSEEIERKGISSLDDIAKMSTGVALTGNFAPQDVRVVIRGLSPNRGRPNVAFLQDGVDISSESVGSGGGSLLINPRLFDVERIEVVKGPQAALYGRSAFAGAINYVTRKPGDVFKGNVALDFGSQGQQDVRGGISGPVIGDVLSMGIDGAYWSNDGFHRNAVTGAKIGGTEGYGLAGTARWKPTDSLTFDLRLEYTDDEFEVMPWSTVLAETAVIPPPASAVAARIIPASYAGTPSYLGRLPDGERRVSSQSEDPRTGKDYEGVGREITRAALVANWDLGPVTLKSLTHVATADVTQVFDLNRIGSVSQVARNSAGQAATRMGRFDYLTKTDLLSQEISVASSGEGPFSWLVGALYWDEDVDQWDGGFNCTIAAAAPVACGPSMERVGTVIPVSPYLWARTTEHYSGFGQVRWAFAEEWAVTAEARYTSEETTAIGPNLNRAYAAATGMTFTGFVNPMYLQDAVDDSFVAPKATLEWKPTDEAMYYLSAGKGIKPAGISMTTGSAGFDPASGKFKAEEITVYELGAKTSWFDKHLVLNAGVFYQDFSDKQTSTIVPIQVAGGVQSVLRPINAAKAEIRGLELELTWRATDELTLGLGYTYLDSEYKNFTINSTGLAEITRAGNCVPADVDGNGTTEACRIDRSGNELPDAPRHAANVNVSYQRAVNEGWDWFAEADANFQDERFADDENLVYYGSYWLADFRLGVSNRTWEMVAYVDNAFDDQTIKATSSFLEVFKTTFFPVVSIPNAYITTLPDGRSYGLRVAYRFK